MDRLSLMILRSLPGPIPAGAGPKRLRRTGGRQPAGGILRPRHEAPPQPLRRPPPQPRPAHHREHVPDSWRWTAVARLARRRWRTACGVMTLGPREAEVRQSLTSPVGGDGLSPKSRQGPSISSSHPGRPGFDASDCRHRWSRHWGLRPRWPRPSFRCLLRCTPTHY
jgi:hypothetical protein